MQTHSRSRIPGSVLEAFENLHDKLTESDEAQTNFQRIRARDVPAGGVFEWRGDYYVVTTGVGPKTGKAYTTFKRPCKAVRISDGAMLALDKARVTYFPDAGLALA